MSLLERLHGIYIQQKRLDSLVHHLKEILPRNASVLDVGCGDGHLAHRITLERADLSLSGIDVLTREHTWVPVRQFDGKTIPVETASVDVVMFIDVLHHTSDPYALLCEAVRVTKKTILIKDHLADGFLAKPTLRFMDHVGNARYGVNLPGNYWHRSQWENAFEKLTLTRVDWHEKLGLYPKMLDLFFGRSLHFLARLDVPRQTMTTC
jgi:SAM-dependent methyltransferase